jgi:TRAP-type uncharacterized transport system substrate-binding protein
MVQQAAPTLRFGAAWQTQFRFVQAIGRGLAELAAVNIEVLTGPGRTLESGDIDVAFTKSINNEHRYSGKGIFAGPQPATWLRTIAWFPQEDRLLFAVAPRLGYRSFEELASNKPPLKMAAQRSVNPVLKEYGFSLEEIERWGGKVESMHHTAQDAREHFERGALDACFGDGSEFDGSAWKWMADRGYVFLDIRPDIMEKLEREQRLRRNLTPAGFLPGICQNLLAIDDSQVVLSCHERLDEQLADTLARVVDERKREIERNAIQLTITERANIPLPEQSLWSSLTSPIERQWDAAILGAPLHPGAERYYREKGLIA